jgi:hypothetical protein
MDKLIVDADLRLRLHNLDSTLELCDESGQTLGHFVPAPNRLRWAYDWARTAFTDDDLERARQKAGGRTLTEILQRLGRS